MVGNYGSGIFVGIRDVTNPQEMSSIYPVYGMGSIAGLVTFRDLCMRGYSNLKLLPISWRLTVIACVVLLVVFAAMGIYHAFSSGNAAAIGIAVI